MFSAIREERDPRAEARPREQYAKNEKHVRMIPIPALLLDVRQSAANVGRTGADEVLANHSPMISRAPSLNTPGPVGGIDSVWCPVGTMTVSRPGAASAARRASRRLQSPGSQLPLASSWRSTTNVAPCRGSPAAQRTSATRAQPRQEPKNKRLVCRMSMSMLRGGATPRGGIAPLESSGEQVGPPSRRYGVPQPGVESKCTTEQGAALHWVSQPEGHQATVEVELGPGLEGKSPVVGVRCGVESAEHVVHVTESGNRSEATGSQPACPPQSGHQP